MYKLGRDTCTNLCARGGGRGLVRSPPPQPHLVAAERDYGNYMKTISFWRPPVDIGRIPLLESRVVDLQIEISGSAPSLLQLRKIIDRWKS